MAKYNKDYLHLDFFLFMFSLSIVPSFHRTLLSDLGFRHRSFNVGGVLWKRKRRDVSKMISVIFFDQTNRETLPFAINAGKHTFLQDYILYPTSLWIEWHFLKVVQCVCLMEFRQKHTLLQFYHKQTIFFSHEYRKNFPSIVINTIQLKWTNNSIQTFIQNRNVRRRNVSDKSVFIYKYIPRKMFACNIKQVMCIRNIHDPRNVFLC